MNSILNLTKSDIVSNYQELNGRLSVYKKKGIDFFANRNFILEKIIPVKGKILEIGTGRGYMSLVLARKGLNFYALDNNKESIRTTISNLSYEKLLHRSRFIISDALNLSCQENSFYNIICINLLHHIEDDEMIISELDRIREKNGKIIIADFDWKGREIVNAVHSQNGNTHSYPLVDKSSIITKLKERGYNIVSYENNHHWILVCDKS